MTATHTKEIAAKRKTLPELLADVDTKKLFESMLGKDADGFQQNIMTVYNSGLKDAGCEPNSIIAACAISASLGLSILPGLGQSCVVPYKDGDSIVAQWQIMTRGVIQLAHRSGQYKRVNASRVYEGQLISYDEHKGLVQLRAERKSDRVQGYYFWFELNTGLTMEFYWSAKKCIEHGFRFSKSFQKGFGKWTEDPEFKAAGGVKKWLDGKDHFLTEGSGADAMSAKTSVKNPLLKWGPLDTKVKEKVNLDQAVIGNDGTPRYVDTTAEPATETRKATPPPTAAKGDKPEPGVRISWCRDDAVKKGVPSERFNDWLLKQTGDQEAVANAAEAEWGRLAKGLKAGDLTSAQAFVVDGVAGEKEATFRVYSVSDSDLNGEPMTCIRDTSEPAIKYFTEPGGEPEKVAKAIKGTEKELSVKFVDRPSGKSTANYITKLA